MTTDQPTLAVSGLDKTFTMHLQGGQRLAVLRGLDFDVHAGECVVLGGASGAGKSSILKMVYGNYAVDRGSVLLRAGNIDIDIATANPREILAARRHAMGCVSQFLRCVPRVPALEVVAEPLIARGVDATEAGERAAELLSRLGIPDRLWGLPPATFSGGEQQRVNIAHGFIADLPMHAEWFAKRRSRRTTIGHDTWIGHGAQVKPDVVVGNGAVIASGAIVTKDVPPYAIVAGVPARVIRFRQPPEIVERLERFAWWDWDHATLRERLDDFRTLTAADLLDCYEL